VREEKEKRKREGGKRKEEESEGGKRKEGWKGRRSRNRNEKMKGKRMSKGQIIKAEMNIME
jgi:hypothetical protein